MRNRQEEIRSKGFDMINSRRGYEGPIDYGKIKVGTKTLDDAVLNLGSMPKIRHDFGNKAFILQAISERNLPLIREISNYFYNTNGIYSKVCDYFAYLYRYDWYITPEIKDESEKSFEKALIDFNNILGYLDNSHVKKVCGDIASEVVKNGAYYGYISPSRDGLVLQQLPINYCRTRFNIGDMPVIEFDMRFFDENFRDVNYRMKILRMFPKEFQKGYVLYKQGKLEPDTEYYPLGRRSSHLVNTNTQLNWRPGYWYTLEPGSAVKFCFNNGDQPLFINAIPAILDLDAAQDLDRRKQMQQLLKIVIQKLPLDKNGDLIFDVDEARDIHNNAVEMLQHAIGVDVLTTFADVQVEDMADSNTTTTSDDLERVERTVYNSLGVSKNLFNTDSNLSLEKSILQDESTMRVLLLQFNSFFDKITQQLGSNKKKYNYRFYMLETTQYNYQNLAKMYKDQVQMGYSKMLPQIAMGHSQSSIIHTAFFENKVLKLSEIMIPPLMSSTLNADSILGTNNQNNNSKNQKTSEETKSTASTTKAMKTSDGAGRPEKADSEKSEKTIQNKESM
nr:MAG TPA: portal protein [Caudoviricetes sp.]